MRSLKDIFVLISLFFFSFNNAQEIPTEIYYQFNYYRDFEYRNDMIRLSFKNPLFSPLRVNVFSEYLKNQNIIEDTLVFLIKENSDLHVKLPGKNLNSSELNFKFNSAFGDEAKSINHNNLALPFSNDKMYTIMQSNKGSFSHDNEYNRFAVDFDMKTGDTVTSADDGFVVGVIKDYEYGKNDREWIPYANYITIYHPHSGLYTQYVHLKKGGSFVKVGDAVKRNQPIGLSGATGFASGEHLHFNVLVPTKNMTLKSVPFSFENDISSLSLKKKMKIKNHEK